MVCIVMKKKYKKDLNDSSEDPYSPRCNTRDIGTDQGTTPT